MHPDLYLRFNSYHPLEHKVGVISIMQLKANTIPTDTVAKEAEEDDIKEALSWCGSHSWAWRRLQAVQENRNSWDAHLEITTVDFKPPNTLHQKNGQVIKCQEDGFSWCIIHGKQLLAEQMPPHRRAVLSSQDSAIYSHLQARGHFHPGESRRLQKKEQKMTISGARRGLTSTSLIISHRAVIAAILQLCKHYTWALIRGSDVCWATGLVLVVMELYCL